LREPKAWTHASPSQIKTFRRCARKWWFEKIAGLKRPPSPAAKLGSRVHDVAERYLIGALEIPADPRKRTPEMRIFAPGSGYLPKPPVHSSAVEYWLGEPGACKPWEYNPKGIGLRTDVVPLVGRVDLRTTDGERFAVVDHKTTSDERWALTAERLAEDVQAAVYTRPYLSDAGVVFRHVYYATKGRPRAWMVEVVVDRDRSDRLWAGVLETLAKMRPASAEAEDRAVPGNPGACGDYGGCPYRDHCPIVDRSNPLSGLGTKPDAGMSLIERLRAEKSGTLPKADDAAERVREEAQREALARAKEAERAASSTGPRVDEAPKVAGDTSETLADNVRRRAEEPGASQATKDLAAKVAPAPPNPPDGTPRDVVGEVGKSAKRGLRLPDGTLLTKARVPELAVFLELDPKARPFELAAAYGVPTDYEGCNGTRGQLLKAIAAAVLSGGLKRPEAEPVTESKPPDPTPPPSHTSGTTGREAASPPTADEFKAVVQGSPMRPILSGFVLFVDCAVERWAGRTVLVDKLLEPLVREVEEAIGTVYYAAPAYREGQRALAERLARDLEDESKVLLGPGDAAILWSSHPAAAEVLDVLTRHAFSVVRGVSR
jgi:hypothetical protein